MRLGLLRVTNIDPFAYDVVPNWSLTYPRANEGYTGGSVPGIIGREVALLSKRA